MIERSAPTRRKYLDLIERGRDAGTNRDQLSCGNLAHGFAASGEDKPAIRDSRGMNIGIVTAFNDMLSAHQPYERYPAAIKIAAREVGARGPGERVGRHAEMRREQATEVPRGDTEPPAEIVLRAAAVEGSVEDQADAAADELGRSRGDDL